MPTRILGIESSCDETAAAVVVDGREILSSVVSSQLDVHRKYGGVVPELASREHLRQIVPVVREALLQAALDFGDIDAVGVTQGPGLVGSLLVGVTYGKVLATELHKPLVAVNHLEGHVHAVFLEAHMGGKVPALPAVCLIVSGGHTLLYHVQSAATNGEGSGDAATRGFQYRRLGGTRDDAAGEAYDKVAKLLGFGYPGGPIIDQLAPHGNPRAVKFTLARMKGNALDFSFSGLKTAVLRWVQQHDLGAEIEARRKLVDPTIQDYLEATPQRTLDLLASFQYTVIEELLRHARASAENIGARSLIVSGGVACNVGLRSAAQQARLPYPVFFPSAGLSTDNAAMIAAAAFPKLRRGEFADFGLRAQANLALA